MALQVIDESHKYTIVKAGGPIAPGNSRHEYFVVVKPEFRKDGDPEFLGRIIFQNGPIKEAGINGLMDENLIAIVIDRLKGFQSGPYRCDDNQEAIEAFEIGLAALQARTAKREAQGIEGTHKVGNESTE